MVWWIWPILLFIVSFLIGIVAVLAGVGGGVLFVPIVSGFFPFHLDFVRCAGLLVALSGALAAGPELLKKGLADLRLAMPAALIASIASIIGAMIGLALPDNIIQIALGVAILSIVAVMIGAKKSEFPEVKEPDALSSALAITGVYHEQTEKRDVKWQIHRTPLGFFMFIFVGMLAGM
ncbi:sulfite exporter TauE/SafE family protein, partial [bacterium]|nr:sulfite exporter TauE/SafE family protein [bacterium]